MHKSKKNIIKILFLISVCLLFFCAKSTDALATDYYVDVSKADDTGSGTTSWTNAKKYLQSVLDNATSGDTVYVAQGTYYPDEGDGQSDGNKNSTFTIPTGVEVYGGYPAGGGTRDWENNTTTLSGDIDKDSTLDADNCYHVVYLNNTSSSTKLDGFTVTLGYGASATATSWQGGGIYVNATSGSTSSPTITNCTVTNNYAYLRGGGIYIYTTGGTASPSITDCTISNNQAPGASSSEGGGIEVYAISSGTASPSITDCTISNNTTRANGGAISNNASGAGSTVSPTITGSTFSGNETTTGTGDQRGGGAIRNMGSGGESSPTITNCTFTNNTSAGNGGAMFNYGSSDGTCNANITSCTFTGNTSAEKGGAIYNHGRYGIASPTISQCQIKGNTATESGGGMASVGYSNDSSDRTSPILTNCLITGNKSNASSGYTGGGGAYYMQDYPGTYMYPEITNCTFSGNYAANYGGGMYLYKETTGVLSLNVRNSIFYNDDAAISDEMGTRGSVSLTRYNNMGIYGTDPISGDPLFLTGLDPANAPSTAGDFHIQTTPSASPCYGTGISSGAPSTDIEGTTRSNPPSVGAYEDSGNTAPSATAPSSISQATTGTGYVSFQTTLTDTDDDSSTTKVEYSDDGGSNWYDPFLVSVSGSGSPSVDNSETYQIRSVTGTSSGNALIVVWDTQSASNGNGSLDDTSQSDIQLRVTPNDSTEDGTVQTASSFSVDNVDPEVSTLSPADNATDVTVDTNLVVTFTKTVNVGTGNIVIKKSSDNSTAETTPVTNAKVSGSGTATITINPSSNLAGETSYYVQIDSTGFDDSYGNSFAGISNTSTWNFTTADIANPAISNVSSNPSSSSAVITWNTNENSSSQVEYGLTSSYGSQTSETDTSPRVSSHSVTISNLKPCARYYYRVKSKDASNNQEISSQSTFSTTGCEVSSISSGSDSQIATSGGSVSTTTSNGTAALTAPNNYYTETLSIQLNKLNTESAPSTPTGQDLINDNFFDLLAVSGSGTTISSFNQPVAFTVSYGSNVESEYVESTLDVYKYTDGSWNEKNCTLDESANTLTCSLDSFSVYGLLGELIPEESEEEEDEEEEEEESDDEENQKAKIISWKAYKYTKNSSCSVKLKLIAKGKHFNKKAKVKIGNKKASSVKVISSRKLTARFCLDKLLKVKTGSRRAVSVTNPDTSREKAKKKMNLKKVKYRFKTSDFDIQNTDRIKNIQQALYQLELFDIKNITGIYGPITTNAVAEFQRLNGLSQTGRVGMRTREELEEETK